VTAEHLLRLLHFLSLFYMLAGLGAVMVPLWRGWRAGDLRDRLASFQDAVAGHNAGLLPGVILVGATGVFLAGEEGYNLIRTGWLVTLEAIYLVVLLVCMPLLGLGLRRVHLAALASVKRGRPTPELEDALADNVPLVFAALTAALVPVMALLAVFRPY